MLTQDALSTRLTRLLRRLFAAALAFALVCGVASAALAQASADPPPSLVPEPGMGDEDAPPSEGEIEARKAQTISRTEIDQRTRDYISSSEDRVTIYQIVQEMIDDYIADARDLNVAAISPLAIRGVAMTPNLSPAFADWVQAQLINATARHANIQVKRCISCGALKTRVDGDDWVVTLGHVTQEELAREAKNLGVVAYLDAYVAYVPGVNVVSMNLQIFRASDGKVMWSETYMSDATTAAVLRSGDRVMTRDEAFRELNRKIEERPYFGYQLLVGMGVIPYDSPTASSLGGLMVGGRLYERFGADKRLLYGLHGEAFINRGENALFGAFLGALAQYQLNQPNLNEPIYRAGVLAQGFLAGSEGNSFAIEANAEAVFQFRLGLSLGVFYFRPTQFAGSDLGGVGAKARFLINW